MLELEIKSFFWHKNLEKYLKEKLNEGWQILDLHDSLGWFEVIISREIELVNSKK